MLDGSLRGIIGGDWRYSLSHIRRYPDIILHSDALDAHILRLIESGDITQLRLSILRRSSFPHIYHALKYCNQCLSEINEFSGSANVISTAICHVSYESCRIDHELSLRIKHSVQDITRLMRGTCFVAGLYF